jgi:hypothetical protein
MISLKLPSYVYPWFSEIFLLTSRFQDLINRWIQNKPMSFKST